MNRHYLQFFATDEEKQKQAAAGPVYAGNAAANTSAGNAAPTYAGTYDGQVSNLFTQITGRQPFNYDVNGDALYQQYKDKYMQQGKQAMKSTLGQAAGLTGGYGSSYGQIAGQQTYDAYLQNLNDVIPDLAGQAYTRYQGEGEALQQQLQNAAALQQNEYGRYQDALGQYNTEQQQAYNRQQDSYGKLSQLITSSGYAPSEDELAAAGMTPEAANSLKQAWIVANPLLAYRNGDIDEEGYFGITGAYPPGYQAPGAGWTGGGGGSSSSVLQAQKDYNKNAKALGWETIPEDGVAGPKTDAAISHLIDYNNRLANHYST